MHQPTQIITIMITKTDVNLGPISHKFGVPSQGSAYASLKNRRIKNESTHTHTPTRFNLAATVGPICDWHLVTGPPFDWRLLNHEHKKN